MGRYGLHSDIQKFSANLPKIGEQVAVSDHATPKNFNTDHLDLKGRLLFEFWTLFKDTQSLICNLTAKLSKQHGIGPECIRLLSRKAAMIITPSLPLKTHPKEHNKHEDLEEGAEDMRVTAQK